VSGRKTSKTLFANGLRGYFVFEDLEYSLAEKADVMIELLAWQ
jgi:hypothetical protein